MKGQETTGIICRVAQQRTQDDASSHGVAKISREGMCMAEPGKSHRYWRQVWETNDAASRISLGGWPHSNLAADDFRGGPPYSRTSKLLPSSLSSIHVPLATCGQPQLRDGAGRSAGLALPSDFIAMPRLARRQPHPSCWRFASMRENVSQKYRR
jgi:hypothetical protein